MGKIIPLFIAIVVILVIVAFMIGAQLYKSISTANEISKRADEIKVSLGDLNSKLAKFNELPSEISDIKTKINTIEEKTSSLELDSASFADTNSDLKDTVQQLEDIKKELNAIQKRVAELQEAYPPVQTQTILFQNMSNEEANTLIQNAISQRSWHLGISFLFGSLFSITLFSIYFVIKKYVIER